MIKWEYKTESARNDSGLQIIHDDLNLFGAEGWELISVCAVSSRETVLYFKRPIAKEPEDEEEPKPY